MGFTKLWSETITSSIWAEDDQTRLVWITMLAVVGPDGIVRASVSGLAHIARVSKDACQKALDTLMNPDQESRSMAHDGRRVERVDGGFRLLNYGVYREKRQQDERREYMTEYMRDFRARKQSVNKCKQSLTMLAKGEGEGEAEAYSNQPTSPNLGPEEMQLASMTPEQAMAYLQREHPDIDVYHECRKLEQRCHENGEGRPKWGAILGWLRKAKPRAARAQKGATHNAITTPENNHTPITIEEQQEMARQLAELKRQITV